MKFLYIALVFLHCSFVLPNDPSKSEVPERTPESRYMEVASRFDSYFRSLSDYRGFNGNILVGVEGNVVYKNSFGFSNLRSKEPLNIRSTFQIASVTKQFTAVAIMMLHEQGKLEYSDTVQKFIPDFPYKNITIQQLLAHRSGLPNYMYFAGKYWKNKRTSLSNEKLLEMMRTYKPYPEFLPDRRYKYSNTGYAVLASIVERISGKTFDEFMEQNVFLPLGMSSTFVFNPSNRKTIEYNTQGHSRNRRKSYEDFLDGISGDKGIYSTVDDLFVWDQALYSEKLVKQTTLNQALTPFSYDHERNNYYGFGFRLDTLASTGHKIVYHGGWWRGYNSLFVRRLEDHTTIIILCNKVNWSFGDISELMHIVDAEDL